MKRKLILSVLFLITLIGPARSIRADASAELACDLLTVDQPQSDACDADIAANPVPNLVHPTQYNPKTDRASRPRAVIPPEKPLTYPLGWVLKEWYTSSKPGIPPTKTKEFAVVRGQSVMVYASVWVRTLEWVMIGKDRWLPGDNVASLVYPEKPKEVTGRWIVLDLSQQTLMAYIDDKPVFATLISAARSGNGVTRPGLFHIYARAKFTTFRGPPWAEVPIYVIPYVPNAMFFDKDIALHGAYWHNYFGQPLTYGCVNVPVADEQWLWDFVSATADQWGPDDGTFAVAHPDKTPFVYVWHSSRIRKS